MSNYLIPLFVLILITSLYSFFWRDNQMKDVSHLSKSIYDYSAQSIDGESIPFIFSMAISTSRSVSGRGISTFELMRNCLP